MRRVIGRRTGLYLGILVAASVACPPTAGAALVSVDIGITPLVQALVDWWRSQPSPAEVRQRVPMLATKLAALAGVNRSLATALLWNGPVNVDWVYATLYGIRDRLRDIAKLIDSIDPEFGAKNNGLITRMEESINEKVLVINELGEQVKFDDLQVRQNMAKVLNSQADILISLSDQIVAALKSS